MKARIALHRARAWADEFVARLAPACERIEVAGSIRRREPEVGDVEIVAVARIEQVPTPGDLFSGPSSVTRDHLLEALAAELLAGRLDRGTRSGPRFRQYLIRDLSWAQLDLFIVRPPAQWGPIFTIRTGPAEYSANLMRRAKSRGLTQVDGHIEDAAGRVLATPTEESFFEALGLPWIDPTRRTA